ncbi:hypothetical protein FGO68_gene3235 [Halteria grandinella]|uniref:TRP C-terminal domain-containing protein n=1 Tax=Halteria grandinella TaxID=5974 RepID=A0A8J8T987_HALGN|nr:hypothetical protein FGO68_gene3235 [Halteria grandinella]
MQMVRTLSFIVFSGENFYAFMSKKLLWRATFRFILQQFQPLLISSLINISSFQPSEIYQKSSLVVKLSYSLSIIITSILSLSMIIFTVIIRQGKHNEERFAPLIEGLKYGQRGIGAYWTIATLLKWTIMYLILVFLTKYPSIQVQILLAVSIVSAGLQLRAKPQSATIDQQISLFNEVMASVYLYTLMFISITNNDVEFREVLGFVQLSVLLFTILVNLLKVVISIGVELIIRLKRRCHLCKRKRVKKYAQQPNTTLQSAAATGPLRIELTYGTQQIIIKIEGTQQDTITVEDIAVQEIE